MMVSRGGEGHRFPRALERPAFGIVPKPVPAIFKEAK
jgi:hypothetical protein